MMIVMGVMTVMVMLVTMAMMVMMLTQPITSARSTRLGADYSYEDSGSCVSGEEEGGIV